MDIEEIRAISAKYKNSEVDYANFIKEIYPGMIKPQWEDHIPYVHIMYILVSEFSVSLRKAREIEEWKYLSPNGNLDDEQINQILNSK